MNIHFIISSLQGGGAERVLTLMANSLAKNRKNHISVITLFEKEEFYKLDSTVHRIKLKQIKSVPSHTLRSIINLSLYYKHKSNRPDLIVSFITLTNLISIIVAKIFSIKIIVQEHNSYLRFMNKRKQITHVTRKYFYKKADLLTVLTSFDVNFYKTYGVNVIVMPNPCSFEPIKTNMHPREKTILAVGNLDRYHHKGFDNLLTLISPILKSFPEWKLKIAGPGDKGLIYLENLAKSHEINKQVIFMGLVDNISEIMRNSSIFILPSRFEGLPMVLLEAMSQGMACISYDCKTGPSDIIIHNENGLLIADQNDLEMQKGLTELLKDETLRVNLSNTGIKSIGKYDISVITEHYEDLFNKIVNH